MSPERDIPCEGHLIVWSSLTSAAKAFGMFIPGRSLGLRSFEVYFGIESRGGVGCLEEQVSECSESSGSFVEVYSE